MKKVLSIFAVALFTIGLFSCEAETSLDETNNLYDINACDGCGDPDDERGTGGGN